MVMQGGQFVRRVVQYGLNIIGKPLIIGHPSLTEFFQQY